jgi:large subunit ribosomal protein L21
MKAVVELGGKQYLVEPGTIFLAEKVPADKGQTWSTDQVLMILDGDDVVLGRPYIEDGKVTFTVLDQTKRTKVIVQKFRPKKGYLRTRGHRQHASQLQVEIIEGGGKHEERTAEKKKPKKKKKAEKKPEVVAEAAAVKAEEPKKAEKAKETKAKAPKKAAKKTETKKAKDTKKAKATKKAKDTKKTKDTKKAKETKKTAEKKSKSTKSKKKSD